jgi:hypothetical protein
VYYLIKILFPRKQTWEIRRNLNTTMIVLLATLLFAGGVAFALYWMNRSHM